MSKIVEANFRVSFVGAIADDLLPSHTRPTDSHGPELSLPTQ